MALLNHPTLLKNIHSIPSSRCLEHILWRRSLTSSATSLKQVNSKYAGKHSSSAIPQMKPYYEEKEFDQELPIDAGIQPDSSGQIFSEYIPLGAKPHEMVKNKGRYLYAMQMIKFKDKYHKLDTSNFPKYAQKKFIDLNNYLQLTPQTKETHFRMKDIATLELITALKSEFQCPSKTLYWRFAKELKSPRIVNAAIGNLGEGDLYAQLTVEMNTLQYFAIRDRHKRLIMGSLKVPKPVTDFVVLERHISDRYGQWRICGKINKK